MIFAHNKIQRLKGEIDQKPKGTATEDLRWSQDYVNPAFYIFVRPELDYLTWDLIYICRGLIYFSVAFTIF